MPANPGMPYLGLLTNNFRSLKKQSGGKILNAKTAGIDGLIGPIRYGVGAGRQHPIAADYPIAKGFGFRGCLAR